MCGIAGKLSFTGPVDRAQIQRMCTLSFHRGPDEEGIYLNGQVGLGTRRLSVIDVEGGHQPLANEDGTIWITYNGEVYNFAELRSLLEARGHRFATRTDTEVIVHLYEEEGPRCVERLNGMFAFALWDTRSRTLLLARDRLGQKPLHYAITPSGLVFASEIAPILQDPDIERRVNLTALLQYLRIGYVPSPQTMFEGIKKLPPAHLLIWHNGQVRLERYWDVGLDKLALSEEEWLEHIRFLLQDAIRIRLVSDVPLGALLSGGLDSSIIVGLMSQFLDQPVKTFSIGFEEQGYNELPFARLVAQHFGTEHHEEIIRPEAAHVLPLLVRHYGEPFGDESCIPTYYLCRMARKHVTVALSGDGGDENFGGYPRIARYLAFSAVHSLRGLLATEVKSILVNNNPLAAMLNMGRWRAFGGELIYRLREILSPMDRYALNWIVWKDGAESILSPDLGVTIYSQQALLPFQAVWKRTRGRPQVDRLLYLDLMTYLPDGLQVKIDIASMANSLEVRAPFLDYRLVELAAAIPAHLKIDRERTKILLRRLARPLLPAEICERSKQGFSPPLERWLAGDLKPMVIDLLLDTTAQQRGFFHPPTVEYMVKAHIAGKKNFCRNIWLLLNFELWCRNFLDGNPPEVCLE